MSWCQVSLFANIKILIDSLTVMTVMTVCHVNNICYVSYIMVWLTKAQCSPGQAKVLCILLWCCTLCVNHQPTIAPDAFHDATLFDRSHIGLKHLVLLPIVELVTMNQSLSIGSKEWHRARPRNLQDQVNVTTCTIHQKQTYSLQLITYIAHSSQIQHMVMSKCWILCC